MHADSNVFDVRAYGATGGANDTAALQEAIDAAFAAGGGIVDLPFATVNHTGITLKANVCLKGRGRLATRLAYTGTGFAITVAGAGWGIEKMRLTAGATSDHLIEVNSATQAVDLSFGRIEQVRIDTFGAGKAAIHLKGSNTSAAQSAYFTQLNGFDILGSGGGSTQLGIFAEDGTLSGVNRGYASGNIRGVGTGVHLDSADGWVVDVHNYEGCGTPIKLTGSAGRVCQANTFLGGVTETNGVEGYNIGANCNDNVLLNIYALTGTNSGSRNSILPDQADGRFQFGLGIISQGGISAVGGLRGNTITEVTANAGVTVDGWLLKDGAGAPVGKADYDAQSILAATADNTPAAVTVGEGEVVGRAAGGNVGALTAAQLRTIVGDAQAATRGLVLAAATQTDASVAHTTTAPSAPSGADLVDRATLNTNLATYQAAVDSHLNALGTVINALIDKLQAAGHMQ